MESDYRSNCSDFEVESILDGSLVISVHPEATEMDNPLEVRAIWVNNYLV